MDGIGRGFQVVPHHDYSSFCLERSPILGCSLYLGNGLLGGGFKDFLIFTPTWGRFPFLTNTFQMGWNHQLDFFTPLWVGWIRPASRSQLNQLEPITSSWTDHFLQPDIQVGSELKKLISLVGGSWGQIPLVRKFELAEKAHYKCVQKGDESSDSYLARCEVVWTELLARNVNLEELQAYIMLRGSRLSPDDKKRVIVDAGAESGGSLEMTKVTAAVRMLGSTFF